MPRRKQETSRTDELLDDLLSECHSPEDILGESGLLKQLSQRLIERALTGELSHHLKTTMPEPEQEEGSEEGVARRNSRNGYSKKTVQSQQGEMELAIPRDSFGCVPPPWRV